VARPPMRPETEAALRAVEVALGLVALEAGVLVTDLEGRPWELASRTVLAAATPELHGELLQMVVAARP